MAIAKTTVKKTAAPVKTAVVKKTEAVGMSGTKLATAKALTKADLQEQVNSLTKQLKASEDMRLSAVSYRDKLAVEKSELARKNADLLERVRSLNDQGEAAQRSALSLSGDVERLLVENKQLKQAASIDGNNWRDLKQSNDTYASQNEKLWEEKKRLERFVANKEELLDGVKVEARNAAARLSKVPGWIRSIFGA